MLLKSPLVEFRLSPLSAPHPLSWVGRKAGVVAEDAGYWQICGGVHSSTNRLPNVPISPETLLAALDAASAL